MTKVLSDFSCGCVKEEKLQIMQLLLFEWYANTCFFAEIRNIRLAKIRTRDILFLLFTVATSNFRSVQTDKEDKYIHKMKTEI